MKHPAAQKHGPLEQLFDDIWIVKGASKLPLPMPLPVRMTRTMTVLRHPDSGELTLVNAMRLSDRGIADLQQLGPIANVMTIGAFHGKDDGWYREVHGATVYALKGHTYNRALDDKVDGAGYMQADVEIDAESPLPLPGTSLKLFETSKLPEALLLIDRDGGIAVSSDALQNTAAPDQYFSWLARLMMRRMNFMVPFNVGPGWLNACKPTVAELRSLLQLPFDHVLPGHGEPVIGGAREKYRPVLEGELPGARR